MLRWPGLSVVLAVAGLISACQSRSGRQDGEWNRFAAGFLETYFEANPLFAVYQGRHEYDGKFPDWSEAGLQQWNHRLHQLRDSAAAFSIAPSDSAARFERDYLVSEIDRDLFWSERADWPHRNPEFYTGSIDPNVYIAREYAPLPDRMRAFTRYAANLPAALASVRANIHTPMAKPFARIGQGRFAGLASYLKGDVPQVFASVSDSGIRREFEQANAGAVKALEETAAWFGEQEKKGNNGFALGPERFGDMLRMTEGVTLPLDSLERRGREDMDRNLSALKEACSRPKAASRCDSLISLRLTPWRM